MEAMDNKCPACGASISFNPKNQLWDCEYCGSKFKLDEIKKKYTDNLKKESFDLYHCKSCGAEVMADDTTIATFCVYCGSTQILKNRIEDGIVPNYILPFKLIKEDAINAFKGLYKGRPLMPKLFNSETNIKKLSGVYVPFWAYNFNIEGDITFLAEDVHTWSDSTYRYVRTNTYHCMRNASMNFEKLLVDGSSRFDDDLMDSIEPFNLKELVPYDHAYLSGFLAEKYDVGVDAAISRAKYRATNTAIQTAKNTVVHMVKSSNANSLVLKDIENEYFLLPVWMLNIEYKGKKLNFAMNGQTGEIVGNIPVDVSKAVLIGIIVFVVSFILITFILMLR